MENIYADIAARTGGNIYIGIVGPVRTGKSTLIKRIMEELVIPKIQDPYQRERAKDELPQSGSGRSIMTSEPKFVPEEAVEICPDENARVRVRMIDSVGYMVPGANGATEDGIPRMVTTPWFDYEIPMTEAAEAGTRKVMQEHCSIGLVVTTDGTVTDIPRQDYIEAENSAICDMKLTGKPFLVVINSREPLGEAAKQVQRTIYETHGIYPHIIDAQAITADGITLLLQQLLYSFPIGCLRVHMPRWMDALENDHPVKAALYDALLSAAGEITALSHAEEALRRLKGMAQIREVTVTGIDLGNGAVDCRLDFPQSLFYEIISSKAGIPIENDGKLLSLLTELSAIKKEYDKLSDALASVNATGYGIVMPDAEQMTLEPPEAVRKNGSYGVKLRAGAPSVHMIRVDIDTEISPMVGDEKQSRDLIGYLSGESPEKLWESHIFGKSVYEMIRDGISAKLLNTPEDVRSKFRGTLTRIVNEGANGLVCLII
ncbi:MAG: stage IV sporulation protein A [Oscillospiraceae bacterium]|nr:stage IV sporulation protein A [Oscillospiraceae bacterium]